MQSRTRLNVSLFLSHPANELLKFVQTPVNRVSRADVRDEGMDSSDLDSNQNGHARWIINGGEDGIFDAVIVNVGTCGEPRWVDYPGMPHRDKDGDQKNGNDQDKSYADAIKNGKDAESPIEEKHQGEKPHEELYQGPLIHSSELDEAALAGKTVLVLGSGASGVEAVETALAKGAQKAIMIARQGYLTFYQ